MSHWSDLPAAAVAAQFNRRYAWDSRNATGAHMNYYVICPECGAPNTKGVRCYSLGTGHQHWIRLRRLDSCCCVLTGVQDAEAIRLAKAEEYGPIEEHTATTATNSSSRPSDNG